MFRKIRILLGCPDIRLECASMVESEFGSKRAKKFLKIYDRMQSGKPVKFYDGTSVADAVDIMKLQLEDMTIWAKIRRIFKKVRG